MVFHLFPKPMTTISWLCGFCFCSPHQSRHHLLQWVLTKEHDTNLRRFKWYQIFLIKNISVAFKLRIYLDILFRLFTPHQTTDYSEGCNATQFNCALKLDIWSLKMNVKQVLCEQRTKIMTGTTSKVKLFQFWFYVLACLCLLKATQPSPVNTEQWTPKQSVLVP